ncbi:MAG: RrF2 family transcriptional regulator [Acidimicrobiales bacterium]
MRLDITRKTDLAVRALRVLDERGERAKSSELADLISSTAAFVPQVLAPLVKKGWIRSEPGPAGGYTLVIDLDEVAVLDVIEAVEGPTEQEVCVLDGRRCDEVGHCVIHAAWSRARAELLTELAATPLIDIG